MTNPEVSAEDDVLYAELAQLSPDGSVFEEGISNTASIRLDSIKDEAISKSLVGLKIDDVVELDIKKAFDNDAAAIAKVLNIPEEDAAELQSKFRLTVKNINRLEEADYNQEFFDKIYPGGEVTTEEQFKAKVTEEIEGMMAQNADQKLHSDLIQYGLDKVQFELPDDFLKRWLKETNQNITAEELESGYNDFAKNLKWTLIENKIIKENKIEIKYEDVLASAKQKLDAQFRMYSPQALPEEQLAQYTVQFLQNKENANRTFEEVKAQKVFEYLKSVITLDKKEIDYNKFIELK
jgi:trigger factor